MAENCPACGSDGQDVVVFCVKVGVPAELLNGLDENARHVIAEALTLHAASFLETILLNTQAQMAKQAKVMEAGPDDRKLIELLRARGRGVGGMN